MLDLDGAPPTLAPPGGIIDLREPAAHRPETGRPQPPSPQPGKGLRPLSSALFVALVAVAGVAGALFWPASTTDPPPSRAAAPAGIVARPEVQWNRTLELEDLFGVLGDADHVVVAGLIIAENDENARTIELTGYSRASGSELWTWTTPFANPEFPPVISMEDGKVVVVTEGGAVSVIDSADGAIRWDRGADDRRAYLLEGQGAVLVASFDPDSVEVLDLASGKELWTRKGVPMAARGDLVFLAEGDDVVVTDSSNGEVQRRFAAPAPRDGETLAALANGDVLMVSPDAVTSLSQGETGSEWEARPAIGVPEQVWLLDDVVQLSGSEGWAAVDSASGAQIWARTGRGLAAEGDYVMLDRQGELAVFDGRNGEELGHLLLRPPAEDTPRDVHSASDMLYVQEGANLAAYSLPALDQLWTMDVASADTPYLLIPIERAVVIIQNGQLQLLA